MLLNILKQQFPKLDFRSNESLSKHTPVAIGGPAEVFWSAQNTQDLIMVLDFCVKNQLPYTIIGWGANTLFSDEGIRGLVIKNQTKEISIKHDPNPTTDEQITNHRPAVLAATSRWQPTKKPLTTASPQLGNQIAKVTVDAGAPLAWVINYLLEQNLVGLENFVRIPATMGGAIYNNIHGNQYFFSEFIDSVKVFDPKMGIKTLSLSELDFEYDYSRFHHTDEVILQVTLKVSLGDKNQAKKVAAEITQQKINQPSKSLGCVWQNLTQSQKKQFSLPTTSVGWLIDHKLNLAGLRIGDAQVSTKHAAFIENLGHATAQDYLAVMVSVSKLAREKFALKLKPEIFFKGFGEADLAGLK